MVTPRSFTESSHLISEPHIVREVQFSCPFFPGITAWIFSGFACILLSSNHVIAFVLSDSKTDLVVGRHLWLYDTVLSSA